MKDKNSLLKDFSSIKKYHPRFLEEPSVIAKKIGRKWDVEMLMSHLDFESFMFDYQEWELNSYLGIWCLESDNYVCWRKDQLDRWV